MSKEARDQVVIRAKNLLVDCLTIADGTGWDPYGRAIREQMAKEAQAHYSTLCRFDEREFADQVSTKFRFNPHISA
jgi:hypothetical protein